MNSVDDAGDYPPAASSLNVMSQSNEPLRENLITTAVNFLQIPKVSQTSITERRAFLKRKGLTNEEIDEALSRVRRINPNAVRDDILMATGDMRPENIASPPRPPRATWRDYANTFMLVSGVSYVTYKFVRTYVMPTWFNVPDPERERLRRLDESMNDVQNGLKFLVDSVQQTLAVVQKQQETLNTLVTQLIDKDKSTAAHERAITELKTEIATVKSLLLSRNQFAPLPGEINIPAWQLAPIGSTKSAAMNSVAGMTNGHTEGNGDSLKHQDSVDGKNGNVSSAGSENGERMTPV